MESSMKGFEHLEIQLEDIKSATNNFSKENVIGHGGFGKVYKGELSHSHSEGKNLVALKRLNRKYGQGGAEFHKEVRMLSRYRHENIISLLGFSRGRDEMILVYEYASRGSLDRYLKDVNLTWTQRLKICLDAAKGLSYLHDPRETNQRLIHCDIKSANILLDENFNAKVADFGLSKIGPANQHNSILVTDALGTHGYCDPMFMETYTLTKESDVYSFGVVLFEVLCGKLCVEYSNGKLKVLHVPMWKQSYEENNLDQIILEDIKQQMNRVSLETFSSIAYQCLKRLREERPTMTLVVEKLEIALQMQVLPKEYIEIANAAVDPLLCRSSLEEFKKLLSKGVLLNGGKTWLSLNDKEEHHVMVSIDECLSLDDQNREYRDRYSSGKSRFAVGCYKTSLVELKLRVTAPLFLSPDVTYGLSLVLHASEKEGMKQQYVGIRYKIQGETKFSIMHFADKKEGKQLVAELYQFNSTKESILDLEILLEDCGISDYFYIEGIEFQPLERVESPEVVANKEIVRAVIPPLFYGFTEEPEVFLSQGVLLKEGKTWLSVNEKGEYIERIYIEACNPQVNSPYSVQEFLRHPTGDIVNSRFPGGRCYYYKYGFKARVRGEYLTPQISYTLNLVFRYKHDSELKARVRGEYLTPRMSYALNLIFDTSKVKEYIDPWRYKIDGEDETKVLIIYPSTHMREDGWFIVPFYHFTSQHTTADLQFEFENPSVFTSLLVAGMEFQPSQENVQLPVFEEYQHIVEAASQSLFYTSLDELKRILSKGVLLNRGRMWFKLDEKGEHCHMISMEDCLIPNEDSTPRYMSHWWSRFPAGFYQTNSEGFKTHVKTQFLSPSITYTVNLVCWRSLEYGKLKYRLRGETTTSTVELSNRRHIDDWLCRVELFQFTSDGSIVELEITFDNHRANLSVEGILFQPLEKEEDLQTLSNSGIPKSSSNTGNPTMKKNLSSTLGKWFRFNK